MQYRRLGQSGIKVSEIALGSWLTYGTVTEKSVGEACVHKAYELGINHFDCANAYGSEPHAAERFLNEALAPFSRDSYVLTSKAFWPVGTGPNDRGLSRKHLINQVDQSLKALGTDYLDIFYCHRYDPDTEVEEVLETLDDLVTQGKILYAGISEWPIAKITEAIKLTAVHRFHKIRASQPVYNMFNRYIESGVLPVCEDNGIGLVVFSPLAQGMLTGKYRRGQALPEGSRATTARVSGFITHMLNDTMFSRVQALEGVAKELGLSLSQLALAWVLRQSAIASALIGASRPEQIEENVGAVGVTLSEETLKQVEAILG
ncbi:MAG: aldo/keto reductase family protein [Sulfobacillus sp.]